MESKIKKGTTKDVVVLYANGYLRISPDLLPEWMGKTGSYFIRPYPEKKVIELQPATNGKGGPWSRRNLLYSNSSALSPLITVRAALHYIGVSLPEKSMEYKAKKRKDDTLVIQF